jgi:hypothetical protein
VNAIGIHETSRCELGFLTKETTARRESVHVRGDKTEAPKYHVAPSFHDVQQYFRYKTENKNRPKIIVRCYTALVHSCWLCMRQIHHLISKWAENTLVIIWPPLVILRLIN